MNLLIISYMVLYYSRLAAKEKILSIKRNIIEIVEAAIEKDVSKEWFLSNVCILYLIYD